MRKSKVLASAVSVALVASIAATAAITASALTPAEVKDHKVGIVGGFNKWSTDGEIFMSDDDGDGVYEATIDIPEVTAEMVSKQTTDTGATGVKETGKEGVCFKVRLDSGWDWSWGEYESAFVRTQNSQTNCCADGIAAGDSVKINVKFYTTKNHPDAIASGSFDEEPDIDGLLVEYTVDKQAATESSTEESSAAESTTETSTTTSTTSTTSTTTTTTTTTSNTTSAASTPAGSTDSNSPATGDTTSAIALVAVVLASLGTAVVMTKKASAKD